MIVGVDYDSYKAVLCALPFDDGPPKWATATFRKKAGEDAAVAAFCAVHDALWAALASLSTTEPAVVWVERGYGMSRRGDWVLGAYFAAICASLCGSSALVNALEAREWKRMVTSVAGIGLTKQGRGNANAPKKLANLACLAMLSDLMPAPLPALTPDELDAFGVAWAGRELNANAAAAA